MLYYVYIVYSVRLDRYYVGQTENVGVRLVQHNDGVSGFTSKASDWEVKYVEQFDTRKAAMIRESEIKRKKSRKYIEWLICSVS